MTLACGFLAHLQTSSSKPSIWHNHEKNINKDSKHSRTQRSQKVLGQKRSQTTS